jgi:hypothetical protein
METTMNYIHLNEAESEARLVEARSEFETDRVQVSNAAKWHANRE